MEKEETTIKLIVLMDGIFEGVKYRGNHKHFINNIDEGRMVRIEEKGKEIWINPAYIMRFELGE